MILIYLLAAAAALAVYALTSRLGVGARVLLALLVFLIPTVSATAWVIIKGDKAPPDAVTVYPSNEKLTGPDEKKP